MSDRKRRVFVIAGWVWVVTVALLWISSLFFWCCFETSGTMLSIGNGRLQYVREVPVSDSAKPITPGIRKYFIGPTGFHFAYSPVWLIANPAPPLPAWYGLGWPQFFLGHREPTDHYQVSILSDTIEIPMIWPAAPAIAFMAAVFWYHRKRLKKPGHCPTCHYNLTGNTSGICPECGTSFLLKGN
jgi:hypothetical protein